MSRKNVVNL